VNARLARLLRYPVKGLAGEALDGAAVTAGGGVPGDRRHAIVAGRTRWDDAHPRWLRKESFVMLQRDGDELLARLRCRYEDAGAVLVATPPGGAPRRFDLRTAAGRGEATAMLNALLGERRDGPVRVVAAGELSLTDIPENGLSIVSLASVEDFARRIGRVVDPLRFRANCYVDGVAPWAERDWIGRTIRIGDVELRVDAHIRRCNATQVDPESAARDLDTVRLLKSHYGHVELGLYARVQRGGTLAVGARVDAGDTTASATPLRRTMFYVRNAWILARSILPEPRRRRARTRPG
jgi:uncharacterized protein